MNATKLPYGYGHRPAIEWRVYREDCQKKLNHLGLDCRLPFCGCPEAEGLVEVEEQVRGIKRAHTQKDHT